MNDIPGYELLRPLGRGGMATVHLAVQRSLGREVALKLLAPAADGDGTANERFLREARIAASLRHPHIVPIHDFGVHQGVAYLAMEYEAGGSVAPLPGERLAPREALQLVRDVALALDYAHGRGVVHRDIKPENILRREDGAAMLSDFGIARLLDTDSALTADGTTVGTPNYMSPEQLRGDRLDGRCDLYSLGVVLWQLLTGELPYAGADRWAIGTQHLGAEIPRLPTALAHLQPLVESLLAKTPEARAQSGAEVARRIDALLAGNVTPAAANATSAFPDAMPAFQARPRRQIALAPLALGVLLLPLAAWLGWRQFAPGHVAAPSAAVAPPPAAAAAISLAVLPLQDLSASHDQGYFSDGMAEELQSRLAQVPGLLVAGRSSSQSFKGKPATVAEIGKALGVANVLEGSVRKDGERLRIAVRLSNVGSGFDVWSQTYDRQLTDVFAVQDEIADSVVEALKLKLLAGAPAAAAQRHTPRFEAYDFYLRGRQALARQDEEGFLLARDSFRKAVELDPEYADAFSGLAMTESFVGEQARDRGDPNAADRRALTAAERAVALDPQLGDAFATRGYLRTRAWQWDGALADVRKAMALDPSDGRNPLRYAYLLATLGRLPEARAALEQGTRVDPLLAPLWYWLARISAAQGDYVVAQRAIGRARAIDADFRPAEAYLGVIALLQGDNARARDIFRQAPRGFGLQLSEYRLAPNAQASAGLRRQLEAAAPKEPYNAAIAYTALGDFDTAFRLLDGVVASHGEEALLLPYDPLLAELHADPRFGALLRRMGLAGS
jgi:TolB-like protein/Tfp pilus assembly protein PilF